MFGQIQEALKQLLEAVSEEQPEAGDWQSAAATLMMEIALADDELADEERAAVVSSLVEHFGLDPGRAQALATDGHNRRGSATSLFEFTRVINQECDQQQKLALVRGLWQVAWADGEVERYEAHLIRRVADLLHLSHSEYVRAKQAGRGDDS